LPTEPLVLPERLDETRFRRACVFLLGGAAFAVDVCQAREVVMLQEFTRVPGAPAPLVGVANLRGSVLPIVEVRPLLGLAPQPIGEGSPAVVLADGPLTAAVAIDQVIGLDWYDEARPLPAADARPCAAFAAGELERRDEPPATLLDASILLAALRRAWA
jgi:purine-binding chemotaxis protein CheW